MQGLTSAESHLKAVEWPGLRASRKCAGRDSRMQKKCCTRIKECVLINLSSMWQTERKRKYNGKSAAKAKVNHELDGKRQNRRFNCDTDVYNVTAGQKGRRYADIFFADGRFRSIHAQWAPASAFVCERLTNMTHEWKHVKSRGQNYALSKHIIT